MMSTAADEVAIAMAMASLAACTQYQGSISSATPAPLPLPPPRPLDLAYFQMSTSHSSKPFEDFTCGSRLGPLLRSHTHASRI